MDRLLREGNPPAGQLASPKPQYKDVQTNNWEELKGEGGASYVKDKDVFAKLEQARALLDAISGKDFATQTTLAAVLAKLADLESELATIKANQLSGDQKVQLSGTVVTLYGGATPAIEPGQELEVLRQKIPNNVGRLKLAIIGGISSVQAMEVTIRTALTDQNLDYITTSFWQTVEKPYDSENWKQLGGNARSKIIDTFGEWVKVSIKNTSTTTPHSVRFYVGGAQ